MRSALWHFAFGKRQKEAIRKTFRKLTWLPSGYQIAPLPYRKG